MAEVLVVASKVKDAIKAEDCNTAGDAVDAISAEVAKMIKKAAARAKENGRKTVRACDFQIQSNANKVLVLGAEMLPK